MEENSVRGRPLSNSSRVLLMAWSVFLAAGFALAVTLEPDPRGFGTHQRLGLPPCSFRLLFGIPCPSCGGTTAFTHFVRGQWMSSAEANAGAFLLALTCAVMLPWSAVSAWRGRLWNVDEPASTLLWLLVVMCTAALVQWIARII